DLTPGGRECFVISKPAGSMSRGAIPQPEYFGNKARRRPVLYLRWACGAGTAPVTERQRLDEFERTVLPHLNAAYNLARWLTRNTADAEDVVQEACLRALRYFDGFAGDNPKAWLLSILRNTCFTWLSRNRPSDLSPLDDALSDSMVMADDGGPQTPERALLAADDRNRLDRLIEALPPEFPQ